MGLRPGEKMTEELWVTSETLLSTGHQKISSAVPDKEEAVALEGRLDHLLSLTNRGGYEDIEKQLQQIVPTYTPVVGDNQRF